VRARERTRVQHLAQFLEQQSQPGNATQQAQEAAAQTELVALNNRMELWLSEEQFKRIAPLNCSLTWHTAVEVYIGGLTHHWQENSYRHGTVWQGLCKRKSGGAQPPLNCLTHLNAALHCEDQAAISEMVKQEQWGAEEVQPPLNRSHNIRYNFNAGCRAGSAPFFVIRRIIPYLFLPVSLLWNSRTKLVCRRKCKERFIFFSCF